MTNFITIRGLDPKGNPFYQELPDLQKAQRRLKDLQGKGYKVQIPKTPAPKVHAPKPEPMTPQRKLIKAEGVLRYHRGTHGGYKLELVICKGIGMFYRSLIPKWHGVRGQRYEQHISVVRKETPKNKEAWGIHEGRKVTFYYDPEDICTDGTYWWLNCWSADLEAIREELGLPVSRWSDTRPLKGFRSTFHTTLGNTKDLED